MPRRGWFSVAFTLVLGCTVSAQAQSSREQLQQLVAQLQQSLTDNALRERIIKLGAEIKPAPAIPEEAVRFEGRAQFAFRSAKSSEDYLVAAREYERAVAAAPWIAGYYSDLCTIYERSGRLEDAKRNCECYLLGVADPAQMTEAKRRIAGLEFGIEKLASENRRTAEEANSPRGRAAAMLAVLNKQYARPVAELLICGVKLNQYWYCTETDARGANWVNSMSMNSLPTPRPGRAEFKITGAGGDQIEMNIGTHLQAGFGAFRQACAKPNGVDPNAMTWVFCPESPYAGKPVMEVKFSTSATGSPLIEVRDGLPCDDAKGCTRAQFTLYYRP